MGSLQQLRSLAVELLKAHDLDKLRRLVDEHPGLLDLRSNDDNRLALLHEAAREGDQNRVRMLLELGADPAERSGEWIDDAVPEGGYYDPGLTAMMLAARAGNTGIVKLLIDHGASVSDQGQRGETAVLFAAVECDVDTLNLLLANGAATDVVCHIKAYDDELGWYYAGTPMHAAADCGWPESVRCLLGHGAQVDHRLFPCGRTPLMYAAARGHHAVIDTLLRAGADPNLRETLPAYNYDRDFTALHYAARNGDVESVRLLLEAGAKSDAVETTTGDTPISIARDEGHRNIVALLKDY